MEVLIRKLSTVPLVVDAVRHIDAEDMVRCAYYALESQSPILETNITIEGEANPFLFIQLEAIILGNPFRTKKFVQSKDIDRMYEFAERHEGMFVDINDIWVPLEWFGELEIQQGMVFRIHVDHFISCWKFRHSQIAVEELLSAPLSTLTKKRKPIPLLEYQDKETKSFKKWTREQIENSRDIYQSNREEYLQKIIEK